MKYFEKFINYVFNLFPALATLMTVVLKNSSMPTPWVLRHPFKTLSFLLYIQQNITIPQISTFYQQRGKSLKIFLYNKLLLGNCLGILEHFRLNNVRENEEKRSLPIVYRGAAPYMDIQQ